MEESGRPRSARSRQGGGGTIWCFPSPLLLLLLPLFFLHSFSFFFLFRHFVSFFHRHKIVIIISSFSFSLFHSFGSFFLPFFFLFHLIVGFVGVFFPLSIYFKKFRYSSSVELCPETPAGQISTITSAVVPPPPSPNRRNELIANQHSIFQSDFLD